MNGYGYTHVHKSNEQDKKKKYFSSLTPSQKRRTKNKLPYSGKPDRNLNFKLSETNEKETLFESDPLAKY